MAVKVILLAVLAVSFPAGAPGARLQNGTRALATPAVPKKSLRVANAAPSANEKAPVTVVEIVPVMVVVEDGSNEEAREMQAEEQPPPGVSASCVQEIQALQTNQSRMEGAEACEAKASHVKHAFEALQRADKAAALEAAASSYHECGGLSTSCAKEVAPQVVLKLRLSGATVSENCTNVAGKASQSQGEGAQACQENMTNSMFGSLQQQDMDLALDAAQHGLVACFHVKHPCDFQLAPVVLMQFVQSVQQQQQQQITEVLLTDIRAAEQASHEEASKAPKAVKVNVAKAASGAAKAAKSSRKALSLLSISRRVHITFPKAH